MPIRDPSDPRPMNARLFLFGAGPPSPLSPERPVVFWGNKTAAGSEPLSTLGEPIADDADFIARAGARSELYAMYRKWKAIHTGPATLRIMCCPESVGTAAAKLFTVTGASSAATPFLLELGGEVGTYTTYEGESQQSVAEGMAAVFDGLAEGRTLATAATAIVGAGPSWGLTLTASQKGPRLDNYIDHARITALKANNTMTVVGGALTVGATEDDWSAPIAAMAFENAYYHVVAKTALATVTATDNGLGELMTMITAQGTPSAGKDQRLIYACVGTNAEALATATSAAMNDVMAHCGWASDSDWSVGEVAAHYGAVVRSEEIKHPSANINGWTNDKSKGRIWHLPPPKAPASNPTEQEIIAALNGGVTPFATRGGSTYIVRHITTRSLNANGSSDYTSREGHIPSSDHFAYDVALQTYEATRQPDADYDPEGVQPPPAGTQTPRQLLAMLRTIRDDLASDKPLLGRYARPILQRSTAERDKANTTVTYDGAGGFHAYWAITPVQHVKSWDTIVADQSAAY